MEGGNGPPHPTARRLDLHKSPSWQWLGYRVSDDSEGRLSAGLLAFCGCIYVVVSIGFIRTRHYGNALAWMAYALANFGFAWEARK
mgnify:CR=1 FL=1